MAAGIAIAAQSTEPGVRVVGVRAEHEGFAIADGIAVKEHRRARPARSSASGSTQMVDVSSEEIAQAIVLCLERTKLVVEGAGAAGVAALLAGRIEGEGPACVVLSGGNVDATTLISVMRHGLTLAGRYLVVRTRVPDRPGELRKLLDLVADERSTSSTSSTAARARRSPSTRPRSGSRSTTRDEEHCETLLATMRGLGLRRTRVR